MIDNTSASQAAQQQTISNHESGTAINAGQGASYDWQQREKYHIRGQQNHDRHMKLLDGVRKCMVAAIRSEQFNTEACISTELIEADRRIFDHIYGKYMK